jgi:hypothetical protein
MAKLTGDVCVSSVTRRDIFKAVAGAAGAVAVVGFAGQQAVAAGKMAKSASQYQASPRNGQSCGKCANYIQASSTCKVVEGAVSANGWCSLYVAKG